jgi:exodeoxyribonuclease VII large subunit
VLIYPTAVQGELAAAEIAATLELANRRRECDLLILTRGGGSLEDLWAFNEEVVARALANLDIPVIVGVGHEIDFTIADFVADQRAPTPSGAAELAVPDGAQWLNAINVIAQRLGGGIARQLTHSANASENLAQRLYRAHPGVQLQQASQRLDDFDGRLSRALLTTVNARSTQLAAGWAGLRGVAPRLQLSRLTERCHWAGRSLAHAMAELLKTQQNRIASAARALESVSPLATLERGYAIATTASDGRVLTQAHDITPGTAVRVRLHQGGFSATVDTVDDGDE